MRERIDHPIPREGAGPRTHSVIFTFGAALDTVRNLFAARIERPITRTSVQ